MADGNFFRDAAISVCEYPAGSGKNIMSAARLWAASVDAQGQLKAAAQTYSYSSVNTRDFWPGILSAAGTSDTPSAKKWNRVWKVTRADINAFRAALNNGQPGNIPASVREWPAAGNVNATGASNQNLYTAMVPGRQYAPFVDADGDGIYNPANGDYPKIEGEEMLWLVYNDMSAPKTATNSSGMGLEVQVSVWCYKRNTIADNIIFIRHRLFNRSTMPLNYFNAGLWADADLGYAYDDYAGFDTTRGMGYVYNATSIDGYGQSIAYGPNPPAAGFVMLGQPVSSFVAYNTYNNIPSGAEGDPETANEFYSVMNAQFRNGTPIPGNNNYMFNDVPGVGPEDECSQVNPPGDRRFVIATSYSGFPPGGVQEMTVALVAAPNAGGCPSVDLTGLQATADTARGLFNNLPPTPTSVASLASQSLHLYPNPAKDELYLEGTLPDRGPDLKVTDVTGRIVPVAADRSGRRITLHTAGLTSGVYFIRLYREGAEQALKFVKE